MKNLKIALIHDYLTQYGGAEKTLEALLEVFPDATIYTGIYNPKNLSQTITGKRVICPKSSLLDMFPKYLTFLMPIVFENFDLREYDILISEGTAWPKGVLTKPNQLHIAYIHTPPRFLYKYSTESSTRNKWYYKPFVSIIDHYLRIWDYIAAQRPDFLLANSEETRKRIQRFYKRDSKVIYPPVETDYSQYKAEKDNLKTPYYLAIGRLSAYKNFGLLVEAFNLLGFPLVIGGTGMEEARLKRMAKSNIKFTGKMTEEQKHKAFEECLGFIFPVVEEDFGIVPIEAMSHGKPVLAHRSGGVLETLRDGIDGIFFEELTLEGFVKKLKEFDDIVRKNKFNPQDIKQNAQRFNKERFKQEFKDFVITALKNKEEQNAGASGGSYNNNRP